MLDTNLYKDIEKSNEIKTKENQSFETTQLSIPSYKYQALSLEAYNFIMKFAPVLEKLITNNINKCIIRSNSNEKIDMKQFVKVNDFVLSEELLNELNCNKLTNSKITYDGKLL